MEGENIFYSEARKLLRKIPLWDKELTFNAFLDQFEDFINYMRIPEGFWRPLFLRALSKSHEEAREFYVEMCNLGLATTLTYQQLKYEAKMFFKQRIGEVDTLSKLIKAKQTEEESLDQWYSRIFKLMIIAVDCSEHAWNDIHPRDGLLSIAKRRLVAGLNRASVPRYISFDFISCCVLKST